MTTATAPILPALATFAERVLTETDGMWPPAARAAACREGLRHIAAECRREMAATATEATNQGEAA